MHKTVLGPRDAKPVPRSNSSIAATAPPATFSVEEFCESHRISRALFYLILRDGSGPAVMRVRGRTLISREAAADWRRRMEAASAEAA